MTDAAQLSLFSSEPVPPALPALTLATLITCRCGRSHQNNTLALLHHVASGCTAGAMAQVIGYPPEGLQRGCALILARTNRHARRRMSRWPVVGPIAERNGPWPKRTQSSGD